MSAPRSVLVTGASGHVGRLLMRALTDERRGLGAVVAVDVAPVPESERLPLVTYESLDVRDPGLEALFRKRAVDTVVHLAAVVNPPPGMTRTVQHEIDVGGTKNVLHACIATNVRRLVVTSSGAAYGYHADSPAWITEDVPLRGNREFAYADHKRQVEALLEAHRTTHPELEQVVLRVGTVIGATVHNQITALFEQPVVIGLADASTPFVFIWDQDLVSCLLASVFGSKLGVFNVAGDGVLTLREIAASLGKPFVGVPSRLLEKVLSVLSGRGIVRYGPEQVRFLRYRPVLANTKLKEDFGFRPSLSSRQAFATYSGVRRRSSGRATPFPR
ncbi:MAG: NAD-dependent epimerase/dehydratase family protein [Deltaproteobacteria bacterium]|nr:NAD-dependent epimerase/dehydratase family protein [Deltaproteobacteria bacterium]